jgi:predicted dithiol-disulfide oxidoreductase (DUF899 family)
MEHRVTTREAWLEARRALLEREKQLTRLRDQLSAERRELPWVKVDKTYTFDTPAGKRTLSELFDGRSQLIIKHFMLAPGRKDPCVGCSFEVDHEEAALVHLTHHDVTYVAVARAPLPEIEVIKQRMGWTFPWVSSFGSDFNYDYHVSFKPDELARGKVFYNFREEDAGLEDASGRSVFYKNEQGEVFHTYSSYARGSEEVLTTYMLLDLTPKGRNENGPGRNLTDWVRLHDRYDERGTVDALGRYKRSDDGCCS